MSSPQLDSIVDFVAWARAAQIRVAGPGSGESQGFRNCWHRDFGRYIERHPAVVVSPTSAADLGASMAALAERAIPYKIRGTAHSSGGQVLIDGGAVIELGGLTGILADHGSSISVAGGTRWLTLASPDRRPPVLTDNLYTTVGGTLAVGGIGDTSIRCGLQIDHVTALEWITPSGENRALGRDDELFRYALGSAGALGALASATIELVDRPRAVSTFVAAWPDADAFIDAARRIREQRSFELVRAALIWGQDRRPFVRALLANFGAGEGDEARLRALAPATYAALGASDRTGDSARDPHAGWTYVCPALELTLPLDRGAEIWARLERTIRRARLDATFPEGTAITVLPGDPALPLSVVPPGCPDCLFIALRPRLESAAHTSYWLPLLREIAAAALDAGGRIYLMSIQTGAERFLDRQFGPAAARLRELKAELDPLGLCNPGLL